MSSPAWELQKAVHGALVGDAALVALLGGARVHDAVPRNAIFPYVTIAAIATNDWSTGTEPGSEHTLMLRAWSKAGGEREVHLVLDAIRGLLHEASLALAGHRLVNLRCETSEATRGEDGETWRGTARFRAVTEPTA